MWNEFDPPGEEERYLKAVLTMGQCHGRILHQRLLNMLQGCCHGYKGTGSKTLSLSGRSLEGDKLAINTLWLFCSIAKLGQSPRSSLILDINLDPNSHASPPVVFTPVDMWLLFDVATTKIQDFIDTLANSGEWESVLCERVIQTLASGLLLAALLDPSLVPEDMDRDLYSYMREHAIFAARARLQSAVHAELIKAKAEPGLFEQISAHIANSDPSTFLPTSLDVWGQARLLAQAAVHAHVQGLVNNSVLGSRVKRQSKTERVPLNVLVRNLQGRGGQSNNASMQANAQSISKSQTHTHPQNQPQGQERRLAQDNKQANVPANANAVQMRYQVSQRGTQPAPIVFTTSQPIFDGNPQQQTQNDIRLRLQAQKRLNNANRENVAMDVEGILDNVVDIAELDQALDEWDD